RGDSLSLAVQGNQHTGDPRQLPGGLRAPEKARGVEVAALCDVSARTSPENRSGNVLGLETSNRHTFEVASPQAPRSGHHDARSGRGSTRLLSRDFADDVPSIFVSADAEETGVSQVVGGSPIIEANLYDELRLEPPTMPHCHGGERQGTTRILG